VCASEGDQGHVGYSSQGTPAVCGRGLTLAARCRRRT
jgi:hypothetical protein